jgi:outer membrane protein assembly factor BamB
VVHGILYALANNDTIAYALRPSDGATLWHYDEIGYSIMPAPVVAQGVTYFVTPEPTQGVVAVRETDGALIKRFDVSGYKVYPSGTFTVGTVPPAPTPRPPGQ